jgi:hypothetical protein
LTVCCVSVKSLNISCEFWSPLSPSFCFQCGLLCTWFSLIAFLPFCLSEVYYILPANVCLL